MGINPNCYCKCSGYWNIEKLDQYNGDVIWRKSIPNGGIKSQFAYNTDIQPLSNGFVVNNSEIGLCIIDNDGKVIVKQNPVVYKCIDNNGLASFLPVLQVKDDLIYMSSTGVISCLDNKLNLVWQVNIGYDCPIKIYGNKLYVSGGSHPIKVLSASDGSLVSTIALTDTDHTGATITPSFTIQDIGSIGFIGFGSTAGSLGVMTFPLAGGDPSYAFYIGNVSQQLPLAFVKNIPFCRQFQNLVPGNPDGTFNFLNDNSVSQPQHTVYPQFMLGYLEPTSTNNYHTAGGPSIVNQMLPQSDGSVIVVGGFGWLPVTDTNVIDTTNSTTFDPVREYKNVWWFNSDGSLRWTNSQTNEYSYGNGLDYGFADLPKRIGAIPNPSTNHSTNCGKYIKNGVAVGSDGDPVVTGLAVPFLKKWTSTARITTTAIGHFHT